MAVSHWKAGSRRQESRRESRKKSGALGESCACRVDILLFFIRFTSLVFFSLVSATLRLRLCEVESVTKIILYSTKDPLDEVKAITHPTFGGPGRERYSLAI
jgi:hypothetical protein